MKALTRPQFQDAIRKGLGRAVAHVREHGDAEVREDILHACTHDLTYDRQCEDGRAGYLLRMMHSSRNEAFYREAILNILATSHDKWSIEQLFDLACGFALRGDAGARQAVHDKFGRMEFDEPIGEGQIMQLDGLDGFLWLVDHYRSELTQELPGWSKDSRVDYLFWQASDSFGEHQALQALSERAQASAEARIFLDDLKQVWLDEEKQDAGDDHLPSVDEVLRDVEADVRVDWQFARRASDMDIEIVFRALLEETRPKQLVQLLRIFTRRDVPRLDSRLFELTEHENETVRRVALSVLSKVDDPWIRQFGLSLLERRPELAGDGALGLLELCYQTGDHEVVERVIPTVVHDEAVHILGLDLKALAKKHEDRRLVPSLLWLYEHGPCSFCRERLVDMLADCGKPPQRRCYASAWTIAAKRHRPSPTASCTATAKATTPRPSTDSGLKPTHSCKHAHGTRAPGMAHRSGRLSSSSAVSPPTPRPSSRRRFPSAPPNTP